MIWAGISLGYRTDLHIYWRGSATAVRYRDEVLDPIVKLYAAAVGPSFVLMDDNARPHRAAIVDDLLESEGIARGRLTHRTLIQLKIFGIPSAVLYVDISHPATIRDLKTALQEKWRLLDSAVVDHLVTSMSTRYTLCMKTGCSHTLLMSVLVVCFAFKHRFVNDANMTSSYN
ncbi:hypothetical protein AVEN_147974-1 [Araneus ventricosus]|uniref:Tc1-like transposase DDE domain-containing protein n=1 Tax=Araneus ventricosus TaxID=182803 RepID=A0A4Y2H6D6_ARAVE|nr:hypothetical protein AVEN_147974-1 [Araneus ventricosus]